jgi:DNA modification methylase
MPYHGVCGKCGATRIDQQLGLEPTPAEYIAKLVAVFEQVRRVLRPDGTCWVNIADSYAGSSNRSGEGEARSTSTDKFHGGTAHFEQRRVTATGDAKPKDLIGIPEMLILALRAAGWYWRQRIVWAKPNPMPESVTDRCTKSWEYVYMLSKQGRYWYDPDPIREVPTGRTDPITSFGQVCKRGESYQLDGLKGANARDVWTIATQPYSGAHFATFPPELPRRCILAGCPDRVCVKCGKPWVEQYVREKPPEVGASGLDRYGTGDSGVHRKIGQKYQDWLAAHPPESTGPAPTCDCPNAGYTAGIVLDPFFGSGTVGKVAEQLGRQWVGIELNPKYCEIARKRTAQIGIFNLPE